MTSTIIVNTTITVSEAVIYESDVKEVNDLKKK